jgi:hypothetical protein
MKFAVTPFNVVPHNTCFAPLTQLGPCSVAVFQSIILRVSQLTLTERNTIHYTSASRFIVTEENYDVNVR